jgi:hypothetical protein
MTSQATTVKVGRWDVPKDLYDEYVKARMLADSYASGKGSLPNVGLFGDFERSMRWQLCVQRVMEVHRKICEAINVPYSEESTDEFYRVFMDRTREDAKLKE